MTTECIRFQRRRN